MSYRVSIEKFIRIDGNTVTLQSKMLETDEEFEVKRIYFTDPSLLSLAAKELEILSNLSLQPDRPSFISPLYLSYYTPGSLCLLKRPSSGVSLRDIVMVKFPLERQASLFYIAEVAMALDYLSTQGLGLTHLPAEKIRLSHSGHIQISDMDPAFVMYTSNCPNPVLFAPLATLALNFEVDGFQFSDDRLADYLASPQKYTDDLSIKFFVVWARQAGIDLTLLRVQRYLVNAPFEDIASGTARPPINVEEIIFPSTEFFFNVRSKDELLFQALCGPHLPRFEPTESFFYHTYDLEGNSHRVTTLKPAFDVMLDGTLAMSTIETKEEFLSHDVVSALKIMTPFILRVHLEPMENEQENDAATQQ